MTPEDTAKFIKTAYLHGKAVADSEFSVDATTKEKKADKRSWREFFKQHAVTPELKAVANANYQEGYDEVKNREAEDQ
jgi:hypothetical protein